MFDECNLNKIVAKRKNTCCYKWDLLKERYGYDDILPFWIADSDYSAPKEIIDALSKRVESGVFGYTYIDDEYYQVVIDWIKRRYLYDVQKDNIVVTPGVVNALYFAVSLFTSCDADIIVQPPVYNPFYKVIKDNGRNLVLNKLLNNERYEIDYVDLENKLKNGAQMLIFCNPHNPVGRVWKYDEVEKVVLLCKKYNCILVSDEIHCDLIYKNNIFTSSGKFFNIYDKIIVCTAASKTFNIAGLICANIIINNKEMANKYRNAYSQMSIEANIFGLIATKTAYSKCEYWLDSQLEYLENNIKIVNEFFIENIPQAKLSQIEGTYLLWINMKFLGLCSTDIVSGLAKEGIAVNNGKVYGDDYDGYIRLNIACCREQLQKGLEVIKHFVENKR